LIRLIFAVIRYIPENISRIMKMIRVNRNTNSTSFRLYRSPSILGIHYLFFYFMPVGQAWDPFVVVHLSSIYLVVFCLTFIFSLFPIGNRFKYGGVAFIGKVAHVTLLDGNALFRIVGNHFIANVEERR